MFFFFFFFQAEDGIRDPLVTGVQTCALPIWVARWKSETAAALSLAPTAFIPKLYACRASRDGVVACSKGVLYFWMVLKDSPSFLRISEAAVLSASRTWLLSLACASVLASKSPLLQLTALRIRSYRLPI